MAGPRLSRIVPAKLKILLSRTWRSPPTRDRLRPVLFRALIASPNTTSCCVSKKTCVVRRVFPAGQRFGKARHQEIVKRRQALLVGEVLKTFPQRRKDAKRIETMIHKNFSDM